MPSTREVHSKPPPAGHQRVKASIPFGFDLSAEADRHQGDPGTERSIAARRRALGPWKQAAHIDWGTILLFGGGLSLGALAGYTGLARVVGEGITGLVPADGVVPITFAATLFKWCSRTPCPTRPPQLSRSRLSSPSP